MGADQGAVSTGVERVRATLTDQPPSLYAVVAVGAALRLYEVGAESYWIDELLSLQYVSSRTPVELALEIPFVDPHPPLFYVLLDLWTGLVGTAEGEARLLSVLFGIGALPLVYLVGAELYDQRVGVLAAGILALSQFHIENSQNARMYSLLVVATLVSMYFLLRLRADPTRRTTLAYFGATVVLVYTHVFGVLVVAAQQCYYLGSRFVREDRTFPVAPRRWLAIQGGVGVLTVPWGIGIGRQALAFFTAGSEGGATPNLDWIPEPTLLRLVGAFGRYVHAGNRTASVVDVELYGVLVLGIVLLLLAVSRNRVALDGERTLLLACWVGVPVLGLFALSYVLFPLFVERYTIAALPGVALFLAKEIRRTAAVEIRYVVAGILLVSLVSGVAVTSTGEQNLDWRGSTAYVANNADGDDVVLTSPPWFDRRFGLYADRHGSDIGVRNVSERRVENQTRAFLRDHRGDVWLVTHANYSADTRARISALFNDSGLRREATREFPGVTVDHFVRTGTNSTNRTRTRGESS